MPIRTFTRMPHPAFTPWIHEHVERSIARWHQSAAKPAPPTRPFSPSEQRHREAAYDAGIRQVESQLKTRPLTSAQREASRENLIAAFGRFATTALGLEDDAVHMITRDFIPAGMEFARWTRRFDPEMSKTDIVQGCRNAWTACGLQPLLGRPTELTPSILAYSLMYPYTDNYIDRADISRAAKSEFSARFRERLQGEIAAPLNQREAALWTLVSLVEGEYPRANYPQVFSSMLAIHAAQERSIAQLRNGAQCTDADVLDITCEKGGSSVLADAFLVRGSLTEDEARFAFEWGVLLQLGDDLQDLRDDLRRQSATLFTRAVHRSRPLDSLVTQLLAFSQTVAAGMDTLPHTTSTLRTLLPLSWRSLIVEAVADLREFFPRAFLRNLERTHPFRLKFLRKRHHRLRRRRGLYESVFDILVENGDQPDRVPLPDGRNMAIEYGCPRSRF